jgi:hypothetical protein
MVTLFLYSTTKMNMFDVGADLAHRQGQNPVTLSKDEAPLSRRQARIILETAQQRLSKYTL